MKPRSRSEPPPHRFTRSWVPVWLVGVPVVAVLVLWSFNRPPETFTADVVESSVEPTDAGLVVADVTWTDEDGVRRTRTFEVTSDLVASGSVSLVASPSGEVDIATPARQAGPSGVLFVITAMIGLAFAVVVLAALRGFGYVRGTGRYGDTSPDDVKESNAFYWRH